RNGCGQPQRITERARGNGRKRKAAQALLDCNLQTASVGARQQLRLVLIAAAPDRANRVDDVSRSEVAAGSNDRVADGTTADASALLVNPRSAFGVNRAIRARALVEPPVRGGDNCIGVLVRDVACNKSQGRLSDCRLHRHRCDTPRRTLQLSGRGNCCDVKPWQTNTGCRGPRQRLVRGGAGYPCPQPAKELGAAPALPGS